VIIIFVNFLLGSKVPTGDICKNILSVVSQDVLLPSILQLNSTIHLDTFNHRIPFNNIHVGCRYGLGSSHLEIVSFLVHRVFVGHNFIIWLYLEA
jgi:hypothetical protein